jgi:hypothetical protein
LAKSRAQFARELAVNRLFAENRLVAALIAYVAIGVLTVLTITDTKLRGATLLILALFAVKSILRRKDVLHPDKSGGDPE